MLAGHYYCLLTVWRNWRQFAPLTCNKHFNFTPLEADRTCPRHSEMLRSPIRKFPTCNEIPKHMRVVRVGIERLLATRCAGSRSCRVCFNAGLNGLRMQRVRTGPSGRGIRYNSTITSTQENVPAKKEEQVLEF